MNDKMLHKLGNKMTHKEFVAKIISAKNETIGYRFDADALEIFENMLLKKEFSELENYKIVMPKNA